MFFPSNYNEVIFMLLCTDVGNTNIKFALYKGETAYEVKIFH